MAYTHPQCVWNTLPTRLRSWLLFRFPVLLLFLITLQAFVSSISFTLGSEEKFKCTTTSRDFGFSKKRGSMPKLGDSSSSLLMFWSGIKNGRFAGLFTASRRSVDSSPRSLSPAFRLFSDADPGDFASLLNRNISSGFWFSLLYFWPLSFDFINSPVER